ncbi:MAG: hypothetical protein HZB87_10390 [Desulfatitalea sp.]|nr:hypothetical protein [Desulfatitalea sp.]
MADFEWKVGEQGSSTRMSFGGQTMEVSHTEYSGYTSGLRDMLTTAMVQTKRYRVLERQNLESLKQEMALSESGYTDKSGKQKGQVRGADLLVMGAVTGWDPGTSGGGGGIGGGTLQKATALFGLGALGGSSGMSGGLGAYAKTPMEKAIRTCIYNAVKYIVDNTPQQYLKY